MLGGARSGAGAEVALLDAAALGAVLRRAGAAPRRAEEVDAAAADAHPAAPARAVQLLELLLHQTPVGPVLSPRLVERWLLTCVQHGRRAPHHLLPELLDLAAREPWLREAVLAAGDHRAAWLVRVNPTWASSAAAAASTTRPEGVDADAWARETRERRAEQLETLRLSDPAAARALLETTWRTDSAADRVALLALLRTGLGDADEAFLDAALDDRSAKVREIAAELLNALPGSARALRHAERLRPLVRRTGLVRHKLEVELPPEPDAAAVRDGLVRPKGVGSVRAWWLQRLAAGAPLEVWTDASGTGPAGTWRMIEQPEVRAGIVEATLARGDLAWAAAVAGDLWHPRLLRLLPAEQVDQVATRHLRDATTLDQVATIVTSAPAPWGPGFARGVVERLRGEKGSPLLVNQLVVPLATGLDPVALPALGAWRERLEGGPRDSVGRICQYLALVPALSEAFA